MKKLLLFVPFCLLAACGAPSTPSPTPNADPDVTGRLADWSSGEAALTAVFYAGGEGLEVAQGTLTADGNFGFAFQSVPVSALNPVPMCEGLNVSDLNARFNSFSTLEVQADGQAGRLFLTSSASVVDNGLKTEDDFYVHYSYAERNVTLSGTCSGGTPPAGFSYDLTLQKGWNTVVASLDLQANSEGQILRLSTGDVPTAADWFYR